jgi:hypothetical protein
MGQNAWARRVPRFAGRRDARDLHGLLHIRAYDRQCSTDRHRDTPRAGCAGGGLHHGFASAAQLSPRRRDVGSSRGRPAHHQLRGTSSASSSMSQPWIQLCTGPRAPCRGADVMQRADRFSCRVSSSSIALCEPAWPAHVPTGLEQLLVDSWPARDSAANPSVSRVLPMPRE